MNKVIITGATGFLGRQVIKKLIFEKNYEVLCIVRDSSNLESLADLQCRFIQENDEQFEKKLLDFQPQGVIHTACQYENATTSLIDLANANLHFPLKLLQVVCKIPNIKWVNTCTSLEQGVNLYALSKHQFAQWGKALCDKYSITFYNVKPELFYGKGESDRRFVTSMIKQLKKNKNLQLTDGFQKRDFIAVEDVVEAYAVLLNSDLNGYLDVPLGTGVAPSIREVVQFLHRKIGSSSILEFGAIIRRPNEPETCVADTSLLNSLGWNCSYDWQSGMNKMIDNLYVLGSKKVSGVNR